jgi:hypothetical protein
MNTQECCNHDCNQGRDCPLRQRNLAEEITEGFKALETIRTLTDEEIQEVIDDSRFATIFELEDFARAILKKAQDK